MLRMEDVIATQEQVVGGIDQLYTNFKKASSDRKTPDYIQKRLETLDQYWNEFHNNHINLLSCEDKSHNYFTSQQYEQVKNKYIKIRETIQSYRPGTPVIKPPSFMPSPSVAPRQAQDQIQPTTSRGSSSKTEDMLKKQASNFKAFMRTVTSVDLDSVSEKWEFEDVLRNLQIRWSAIDSLHWELDSELGGSNQEYEQQFNEYESHYNKIKKAVNKKMWSVAHVEKSTPKIEIPSFNGNYSQWVSFKDLFTETIHNNPSLSNAQKMQFLKGKIKGEAERLIQHLNISSENYSVCWEILAHRYDNKKLIFTSLIGTLMNVPTVQHLSISNIKRLHDTANESLNAIKNLGIDITSWDPLLVYLLSQKIDVELYNDYMESLKQPRELPKLADFMEFLEIKFTTLETSKQKNPPPKPLINNNVSKYHASQKPAHHYNALVSNTKPVKQHIPTTRTTIFKCPICSTNDHGIYFCQTFLNMPAYLKKKTVLQNEICPNCLHRHTGKPCISENRCRECNRDHNSLLHHAFTSPNAHQAKSSVNAPNEQVQSSHVSQNKCSETLLATALIKVKAVNGVYHTMRALLDQGSQASLISENAAQILKIPRQRCVGVISGIGAKESSCKGLINIECASTVGDFKFETDAYIMNQLIRNLPSTSFSKPDWSYLDQIKLADPEFYDSRPVDILLGADVYSIILMDGICRTNANLPTAQQTKLGWILSGNVKTLHCNVILNNLQDIQSFWEIEEITESSKLPLEDQECIELYKSSTTRKDDGRYEVRLPMKRDYQEKLGESKTKAVAQFYHLERKLQKQPEIAKQYKQFMNEYIALGHMIPCSKTPNQLPTCYLPHHAVLRSESTSSPLRVVYNAASATTTKYSLNDLMCRGPNLQQDLQCLIIKWRQYQYAFTADVEKMYRGILLHPDDQQLQRIVWRDDPSQPLQDYQLVTLTYGFKVAPYLAMMTLKQLAQDERKNYQGSSAPDILENSFYMDDLVHGAHTTDEAKQLKQDMIKLLRAGGFNLRKWKSNVTELQESSNGQQNFDFKQAESSKTLGVGWNPKDDNFIFSPVKLPESKPTKRNLLSDMSRIYDPLGWLTPITTKLKILFQETWKSDAQWDEQVSEEIAAEWQKIKIDLHNLDIFKIPRWLKTQENSEVELHGFCDASIKAFACVVYCKTTYNGATYVIPIAGKSKLVPVNKHITLPRLELSGAMLLSRLMAKIKECLNTFENIKIYGWVDSMVVLGWLNGEPNKWNAFVANRVTQITDTMPSECWRYVRSQENPADCASRGITVNQLQEHNLWWRGPEWLPTYEQNQDIPIPTTELELKKQKQVHIAQVSESYDVVGYLLNKFSSLAKAIRVLARVRKCLPWKKSSGFITVTDINEAEAIIIKYVQNEQFSDEIEDLKKKKGVSCKSKLFSLCPILDEQGILRVGGRLENAQIEYNMKHPIIVDKNTRFSDLIIDQAHQDTFHGGARMTTSFLRRKYWLLGGIQATKKRLRNCVKCKRHNNNNNHQIMGDLPSARTNPSRPFYHTGVDYTGHVFIKANKGRGIKTMKGYVAVFICMVTKAVHLELVSDLTSSAFLAALRRMAARRSVPAHLYSDNGTNFQHANKVLQQEYTELKNKIEQEFDQNFISEISEMGITWHFNAPSWPSAGGLWEAAVKSLKHHLKRVVGETRLTFEEYSTLLAQLEACMNSRPLCPLTEDPEDLDFLTPAHFLACGPTLTIYETERDLRTRWQLTQKIFTDIWNRWRSEYLTQLSKRSKWRKPQDNINMNDVVIIKEDNLPPGKWALGRVVDLHPGSDGHVRVVTLKTKNGLLKRPIVKLAVLPIDKEDRSQTSSSSSASEVQNPKPCISDDKRAGNKSGVKGYKKLTSLALTLMVFLITLPNIHCSPTNITRFRDNQGLYLAKLQDIQIIKEDWKIVVYYDINPYYQGLDALNKYINHLTNMCSIINKHSSCDIILQQLRHGYSELNYYNDMLLSQHTSGFPQADKNTRWRRGLIDGVGYLANSLFGVLDQRFAEQYQKDIMLMSDNQHHLLALWKNQTSIIESEYNVLKRTEDTLNKQQKLINQQTLNFEKTINNVKLELQNTVNVNEFALGAITATNMLQCLKNIQEMLLDTLTDIYQGTFNFHIITPNQLRKELNIIANQISKELCLPIDNPMTDLRKIYQLLKIKTRFTESYIFFEIKVPLVLRDSYELYRITSIPRKVQSYNMLSIVPTSEYVAINIHKDTYIEMTETDATSCLHNGDILCCQLLSRPIYHIRDEFTFCSKNKSSNECNYVIELCKDKWLQTNRPNTHLFFICNQTKARIICSDQVTVELITGAGLLTVDDNCIIKTDDFILHGHKQRLSRVDNKADISLPVLSPINNYINITVPIIPPTIDTQESDKALEDIRDNIQKVKESATLAAAVSYHDVHHYVAIYCIVGAGAALAAGLACRRARAPAGPTPSPRRQCQCISMKTFSECDNPVVDISSEMISDKGNISERQIVPKVNNPGCSQLDKGSSPIRNKVVFPRIEATI
ncbi:hypothetical protein JYU34_022341 [Plutella xylostella]|uniref:Endonuclease n=1 Tax=Plutella xylostella TaxID=51655 RepID=A0ABQ7PR04_PLUXY|nr:hypothetical protein JYU34_022341 [Plutella xylostella]